MTNEELQFWYQINTRLYPENCTPNNRLLVANQPLLIELSLSNPHEILMKKKRILLIKRQLKIE